MNGVWGKMGYHLVLSPVNSEEILKYEDILIFLKMVVGKSLLSIVENPDGLTWLLKIKDYNDAELLTQCDTLRTSTKDINIKIIKHEGLSYPWAYYDRKAMKLRDPYEFMDHL